MARIGICVLAGVLAWGSSIAQGANFRRGDSNVDGNFDISDPIQALGYLFLGDPTSLSCDDAADTNDDGSVDITDGIYGLSYLFTGGPAPLPPFEVCGPDPTPDDTTCDEFARCPQGPPPPPIVDPVDSPTSADRIVLSGGARPGETIEVARRARLVGSGMAAEDGSFSVSVDLVADSVNGLFVSAIASDGQRSAPTPVEVRQDSQAPSLFIDSPPQGSRLFSPAVTVAGRVSDLLSGFMGLSVTVAGEPANVDIGIGTNGTFERADVPLSPGENTIIVVARDEVGNEVTKTRTVTRAEPAGPRLEIVSGNNQVGQVQRRLSDPLVVRLVEEDGTPIASSWLVFRVRRSDGLLSTGTGGDGASTRRLELSTDASGEASVSYRLGTDAGCGNNRVEVNSGESAVLFYATAVPGPAAQINVGSGASQRGETGGPAPEHLRVWVSDGCNGIEGVPVTFSVVQGGGLVDGEAVGVVETSTTGHAEVDFTLGPDPGNNMVEANFPGNTGNAASFFVYGVERDDSRPTSFSGLVLDNSSQPIAGAECVLFVAGQDPDLVLSDINGQFRFENLAGGGPGHLSVNGLRATHVGGKEGKDILRGSFPALAFDVTVVPNSENSLAAPVLLPRLDPRNSREYSTNEDTVLKVEDVEGLEMRIAAGSMQLPDGSPAPDGTLVSLNQVHHDDVPMPIPDGAAPPFAWTLQPAGATFDPPVQITYPNMSGLAPGAIAYFLSFDHDTGKFEIVASGSVSDDGAEITTDDGAGLTLAGWGCNCPPYSVTGGCQKCADPGRWEFSFPEDNSDYIAVVDLGTCGPEPGGQNEIVRVVRTKREDLAMCDCDPESETGRILRLRFEAHVVFKAYWSRLLEDDRRWAMRHGDHHLTIYGDFFNLVRDFGVSRNGMRFESEAACESAAEEFELFVEREFAKKRSRDEEFDRQEAAAGWMAALRACGLEAGRCRPPQPDALTTIRGSEVWAFVVGGRLVAGDPAKGFRIGNISAADLFGLDGPGSIPDFLSDDAVRVLGTAVIDGQTRYAYSEPFRIRRGETFLIEELTITDEPPPFPETLTLDSEEPAIAVGSRTPLTATGALFDGTEVDVSTVDTITYRVSNTAVASVEISEDGAFVTGLAPGRAFITATIEGVTSVAGVFVREDDGLVELTLTGRLSLLDGSPAADAIVQIALLGASTQTAADGSFSLSVTAPRGVALRINFSVIIDGLRYAAFVAIDAAAGNTDLGDIALSPVRRDFPGRKFTVGEFPVSVATGDFDGDGALDLAVVNTESFDNISVLLGAGDGTFGREQRYGAGEYPTCVITGDLDSDGAVDLVVANSGGDGLSVLLGEGDGSFSPEQRFAEGGDPLSIAAGDLDGDGALDLAVVVGGEVSVLLGVGDGSFRGGQGYAIGRFPLSVVTGDFDGDGALDLAVANGDLWDGGVSVLLGGGDGSFFPEQRYPAGDHPRSLASGDTDENGTLDLLVVSCNNGGQGGEVSVLLGVGDGSFDPGQSYATGSFPRSVAAGDLDGDGALDLAFVLGNEVSVFVGLGDASFAQEERYAAGWSPSSLVMGDFDSDGALDLVVANSDSLDVSVLLGLGDATFDRVPRYEAGENPRSLSIGDLNSDGVLDVAVANWGSNDVSVLLGSGGGSFRQEQRFAAGSNPRSIVTADFDGDFSLDVAVANESSNDVSVLLGTRDGNLIQEERYAAGLRPQSVTTGDFDDDGALDLAVANGTDDVSVLLGLGDGRFAPAQRYVARNRPPFLVAGEFSGDGVLDLAVATDGSFTGNGHVTVLLGVGDGTFVTQERYESGGKPRSVAVGDFDGDEVSDLVVANHFTENFTSDDVSVFLGVGDGSFAQAVHYAAGIGSVSVTTADFDGDGLLDMAVANDCSGDVSVLLGLGDGSFSQERRYGTRGAVFVASGDFDGDGTVDLVVVNGVDVSILLQR